MINLKAHLNQVLYKLSNVCISPWNLYTTYKQKNDARALLQVSIRHLSSQHGISMRMVIP